MNIVKEVSFEKCKKVQFNQVFVAENPLIIQKYF
jgi:hypothetical protein